MLDEGDAILNEQYLPAVTSPNSVKVSLWIIHRPGWCFDRFDNCRVL